VILGWDRAEEAHCNCLQLIRSKVIDWGVDFTDRDCRADDLNERARRLQYHTFQSVIPIPVGAINVRIILGSFNDLINLKLLMIGPGNPRVFLRRPVPDLSKTRTLGKGSGFLGFLYGFKGVARVSKPARVRVTGGRQTTDYKLSKNMCYSPWMVSQSLGSSSSSPVTSSPSATLRS